MMDNENQNQPNQKISFESLDILIGKWRDGTFSEIIDDWKWIFSYSKRYKGAIAFYTILGIFSTSMGLVGSVASKYMIDIITGYQMSKLWIMVLITLGSAFFSLTIGNVIGRISTKLSIYINNDIQADIFDKIIDADWMEINKYSNGDVLNRFNSDVNTISGNAISWLPTIIIAVYDFVATFAVIWHYDKIMSLLAFASAPFMLLMSKFLISKQREYGKKVREMSSEMMTFEVETFYNFDTIKSFGISSLYGKKMRNWQEKFKDISLKYNMFTIKTNIVMSIIGMVVQYAAFGYCLFRLWTRDISYGTMTLFLQQRSNLNGAFNNLVSIIPNFLNSSISAHRIRELAQLKKEVHIPESSEMDAYVEDGFEVKMRDVDFSYIEGNRVITDSAFMANPGEIVALVGPSGSGKTTICSLLPRFYDVTGGKITVDGKDVRKLTLESLRNQIGLVQQDVYLFCGSIRENIAYGKPDATMEEIEDAAKKANIHDFIMELPDGYETFVGERGTRLSGGQKQRISIARVFLKNPPILILDEATSALDNESERWIQQSLEELAKNRTTITIAHRLSTIRNADEILVVADNGIAERGTHDELIARGGIYAHYYEMS